MARRKHAAGLKARGLRCVRLWLPIDQAEIIHRLAKTKGVSPGAIVGELLALTWPPKACGGLHHER
jgi:hypothetical protein